MNAAFGLGARCNLVAVTRCTPADLEHFWSTEPLRGISDETLSLDFLYIRNHHSWMNLILSTHNVTLTKAIEDHVLSRINKLQHLNQFAINARVTLEHDHSRAPEKQFSCSIRLNLRGPDLFAEDVARDLYTAIDIVAT